MSDHKDLTQKEAGVLGRSPVSLDITRSAEKMSKLAAEDRGKPLILTPEVAAGLRRTVERLRRNPAELDMDDWVGRGPCGTTGCFAAGIIVAMTNEEIDLFDLLLVYGSLTVPFFAEEALGVPYYSLRPLFFTQRWPADLYYSYNRAIGSNDPAERVEVLAEVVERFIACGGNTQSWVTAEDEEEALSWE